MNRTIKDATIKAYEYSSMEQLRAHVLAFVQSYNFGKHLKALRWKTPFRTLCEAWSKDPSQFKIRPHHLTVGSTLQNILASQANGRGASGVFPSLVDNPVVTQANPDSLIGVILAGSRLPSPLAIPPFGWRYDDEDVAQLATFVRSSWGNHGPAVTAKQVAAVRAKVGG